MKTGEFYRLLDDYAPFSLSDELCRSENLYDNSGVIVDCDNDFSSVLVCLDLTKEAVKKAKEMGCGLILTHHPAIYKAVKQIDGAVLDAVKNGISVVSAHLNLDCAPMGVDYFFARGLGAKNARILTPLSLGGYGRMFRSYMTLGEFVINAIRKFLTRVDFYGDENSSVGTVVSFCGEGLDEETALSVDADTYCSADIKHHVLKYLLENGKNVVNFSHFASENYGMRKIAGQLEKIFSPANIKIYFFDDKRFK